jgi:hypothetical protein
MFLVGETILSIAIVFALCSHRLISSLRIKLVVVVIMSSKARSFDMILGKCYTVIKELAVGEEVSNWVFAGVILAKMGVSELGNTCPICNHVYESPWGVYNHLKWGYCSNKFIDICMEAHELYKKVKRVVSMKSSRSVISGEEMFKIYLQYIGNIYCKYRDVKCVAENMMKILKEASKG